VIVHNGIRRRRSLRGRTDNTIIGALPPICVGSEIPSRLVACIWVGLSCRGGRFGNDLLDDCRSGGMAFALEVRLDNVDDIHS
jgi:hypothetical protein